MNDGDKPEKVTKEGSSDSVLFHGSNVLYYEYPIERVFSTIVRNDNKDNDFDSAFGNVNKCSNDKSERVRNCP